MSFNPAKFARNFFSDQKMIWTFPGRLTKPRVLIPTLAVIGITLALTRAGILRIPHFARLWIRI